MATIKVVFGPGEGSDQQTLDTCDLSSYGSKEERIPLPLQPGAALRLPSGF